MPEIPHLHQVLTKLIQDYADQYKSPPDFLVCYSLEAFENIPRPMKLEAGGETVELNVFFSDVRDDAIVEAGSYADEPIVVYKPEAIKDQVSRVKVDI